jgi:NADPH:quinone reductase-like Zn-dependent oxidoreductase
VKSLGATVTAVCSTENVTLVERLGADSVIDGSAVDFTKDERTYDVVFDAVGKSSFRRCKRLLKPTGIYLDGRRTVPAEPDTGASYSVVRWQEGPNPVSEA